MDQALNNSENEAGMIGLRPSGPRLIRHEAAPPLRVSDDVYLAAYARIGLIKSGARRGFSKWKLISLSAVAGVALTLALVAFSRSSAPASRMSSDTAVSTTRPSLPILHAAGTQTTDEKLLARNRRLEALVEILRERRKAKADSHLSHISTN